MSYSNTNSKFLKESCKIVPQISAVYQCPKGKQFKNIDLLLRKKNEEKKDNGGKKY